MRSPLDLSLIALEAKTGSSGDGGGGNIVIGGGQQEGGWDSVDGVSATLGALFEQRLWTTPLAVGRGHHRALVDTNGFKAEFGHAGGAAASFVSRSGLNIWRGKAFEFFRTRRWTWKTYFNKAAGKPKRRSSSMIWWACSAAGSGFRPLRRQGEDVLLRFDEAYRNKSSAAVRVATIPNAEMEQRRFSNWCAANGNLISIYDPATTR